MAGAGLADVADQAPAIAFITARFCSSSQDKLLDTERVQQSDLTRSLAQEVQSFDSNLTQQL